MLTVKHMDEKWTRIVHVSYDKNEMPMEKHVTFKFKWDLERLTHEFEKNGAISFKYMVTDRCKQHLTYFGDYQIGLTLTVFMSTARTVDPYVVGKDMAEEIEVDFHVPLVEQGSLSTGYTSKQPTNENLKQIMEHKITHMVDDYKQSTTADAKNMNEINEVYCTHCNKNPCVWGTNKEAMLRFD